MKNQDLSFHFKSNKDVIIAEDAKAAFEAAGWKATDKGWKRPSVTASLPELEQADVIEVLEAGGAGTQFLLAVCNEQFYLSARNKLAEIISTNPMSVITPNTIAGFGLEWNGMAAEFLAAMQETRSTGIPKEVWDDFEADYVSVMMQEMPANGEERIKNAAAHLKARFTKCRSNKPMVKKLQSYLAVWFAATGSQAEYARVYENLNSRAETLLNASDEDSI